MDKLISFFTNQWPRKLIALAAAIVVWLFVDQSITDTAVIANVPIRVINLPDDKTIPGIQPNGILSKRINLTLSGTKNVIQSLGPGDLQVLVDAGTVNQDEWILHITRNNLVSLNPSVDLRNHISHVRNPDYIIKLSKLEKAAIPIKVTTKGTAPPGYEFLDVWPRELKLTFVGPEEEIRQLSSAGLDLELDMSMISKSDLDKIENFKDSYSDEVGYFIPIHWKRISHPLLGNAPVEINDPDAHQLHLDFLRKRFLPIEKDVPIRVYYPLANIDAINPIDYPLLENNFIKKIKDTFVLSYPLFAQNVSSLFLDIVRSNLEIVIIAQYAKENESLEWSVNIIDSQRLENKFVAQLLSNYGRPTSETNLKMRENHLRYRFRKYMRKLALYRQPDMPFHLAAEIAKEGIYASPVESR